VPRAHRSLVESGAERAGTAPLDVTAQGDRAGDRAGKAPAARRSARRLLASGLWLAAFEVRLVRIEGELGDKPDAGPRVVVNSGRSRSTSGPTAFESASGSWPCFLVRGGAWLRGPAERTPNQPGRVALRVSRLVSIPEDSPKRRAPSSLVIGTRSRDGRREERRLSLVVDRIESSDVPSFRSG